MLREVPTGICASVLILLCGCNSTPLTVVELSGPLTKNGWIPVDLPRKSLRPGAIVQITKESGITWLGEIGDCITDSNVTRVLSDPVVLPDLQEDAIFDASLLAKFHNISFGPKGNFAKSVKVVFGKTAEDRLDYVKVDSWLVDNRKNLGLACSKYFAGSVKEGFKPDVWIVEEALSVESIDYTFKRQDGLDLPLTNATIGQYLNIDAKLKYSITTSGGLHVETPTYLAFKRTTYLNGEGQGIGGSNRGDPKAILSEYYSKGVRHTGLLFLGCLLGLDCI
jgi:hypothetical protein